MKKIACLLPIGALVLLCASTALCRIDVNTASQSELEGLPGIGPSYAKKIIEGRPYRSVNDLRSIKGIGSKTLDKLRDLVTVGAAEEEAPPKVVKREPIAVPLYSVESFRLIQCYECKNRCTVSSELKNGLCPYCGASWRLKEAAAAPPESSVKAEKEPGVISFKDAGKYVDQTKTVEGTVVETHVSSRSGNLYMNFHEDYRTYLSIKIPASNLGAFHRDAESYYKDKKIIATGEIKREDGEKYLRMIVTDPANLKVVE